MKNHYTRFTAIVACLFIHQLSYAQWPQWRGPMRDGSSTETNLLKAWPAEGPGLLWSSDTIGDGYGSAIMQDKVIYVTGTKDSSEILTAFDLNGKLIWQKKSGKALKDAEGWVAQGSTPTFYKNRLYAFTCSGDLVCMNAATGESEWTISIPEKFEGAIGSKIMFCESPLVADDKVILTTCGKKAGLVALNSFTGETVWASECVADTGNFVSPVLIEGKNKKLIVTSTQNYYLAVDFNTGKIVWKEKGKTTYVPLPGNKQVYFTGLTDGGKMLNISDDLSSFNFTWCDSLKINLMGGAVRLGTRIFGTYNRKGILCIDWKTGEKQIFTSEIKGANLLAADGMIYSYEGNGVVSLLKPMDNNIDIAGSFKVKLGTGPNLAHLSIGNGILFIRHGKTLMAYDIRQV
ncbi:MAG: PQQ-binding-like beta-propeller repeat protein [Bacteroidales bacterium]|jgi:outer membrane protein assembly factor BamB